MISQHRKQRSFPGKSVVWKTSCSNGSVEHQVPCNKNAPCGEQHVPCANTVIKQCSGCPDTPGLKFFIDNVISVYKSDRSKPFETVLSEILELGYFDFPSYICNNGCETPAYCFKKKQRYVIANVETYLKYKDGIEPIEQTPERLGCSYSSPAVFGSIKAFNTIKNAFDIDANISSGPQLTVDCLAEYTKYNRLSKDQLDAGIVIDYFDFSGDTKENCDCCKDIVSKNNREFLDFLHKMYGKSLTQTPNDAIDALLSKGLVIDVIPVINPAQCCDNSGGCAKIVVGSVDQYLAYAAPPELSQ
jgi:hypothetical protein